MADLEHVRTAYLIATSNADDAAFVSLLDLAAVIEGRKDSVVIGGHMVGLMCAAFPTPGLVERRTQDADGGVEVELASTGDLHTRLIGLGYTAENSNRYVRGEEEDRPTIDLLVPTVGDRFHEEAIGDRRFDAMPGLRVAMANTLLIDAVLTFQDHTERRTIVRVPTIEGAVLLKAIAWGSRRKRKDAIDLSNLFAVLQCHGLEALGGPWRLNEPVPTGNRLTAARHLHGLADIWDANPPAKLPADPRALVSRIRSWVTDPR